MTWQFYISSAASATFLLMYLCVFPIATTGGEVSSGPLAARPLCICCVWIRYVPQTATTSSNLHANTEDGSVSGPIIHFSK